MGKDPTVDRKRNLTLVMTHQCNFDCKYCLQKHEDVYMPRETAVKAIDMLVDSVSKIKEQPKAQISFYGGEPLLARKPPRASAAAGSVRRKNGISCGRSA